MCELRQWGIAANSRHVKYTNTHTQEAQYHSLYTWANMWRLHVSAFVVYTNKKEKNEAASFPAVRIRQHMYVQFVCALHLVISAEKVPIHI